jgi:hypothetical protein
MPWSWLRMFHWRNSPLFARYYPLKINLLQQSRLPSDEKGTRPTPAENPGSPLRPAVSVSVEATVSSPQLQGQQGDRQKLPERPAARTWLKKGWHLEIYRLPKLGNQLHECEDAWAYACNCVVDHCSNYGTDHRRVWNWKSTGRLTIAISDGASDSYASAEWAQLLTYHAAQDAQECPDTSLAANDLLTVLTAGGVSGRVRDKFLQWLHQQAEKWRSDQHWENLPWFIEAKAEQGAHATLLVADFVLSGETGHAGCSYRVLVVGDNCLFHFRGGQQLQMIPRMMAKDFGVSPALVSTDANYNIRYLKKQCIHLGHGQLLPGDEIWLATDALSAWIVQELQSVRGRQHPATNILPQAGQEIVTFLNDLRSQSRMKNDDVTLVRLRWLQDAVDHSVK